MDTEPAMQQRNSTNLYAFSVIVVLKKKAAALLAPKSVPPPRLRVGLSRGRE